MSKVSFNFVGKRVLVTGAGRGIGRAIAKALAEAGAETFALSKTLSNLQSLVTEIPSIHPIHVDLSDWESTRKSVEGIGQLDLLVNNAGTVIPFTPVLETSEADIDHMFQVNLKGVINVSQVVAKNMVKAKITGAIVNISSTASLKGYPGIGVYGSSKGALDQITRVMAIELGEHQIRVNSVNPSVVWTDMTKLATSNVENLDRDKFRTRLGRFLEIPDVVDPVLFLLSDSASMITGTILSVDGGEMA